MALGCALLCQRCGVNCEVVEGTLSDRPWFWNEIRTADGTRLCLDCVAGDGLLHTAEDLTAAGYRWSAAPTETAP